MFPIRSDDTKFDISRAQPTYYVSYSGNFGLMIDVVMYGSSKPTTDEEIFRRCFADFMVCESVGLLKCVGVCDDRCGSMTGKNGRLLARSCQTVQISTQ